MAETDELNAQPSEESECTFQWDENSQLYFHSSTGFYYNPTGGWYYSSRDGLYYKFENGNYVLLGTQLDQSEVNCSVEGNASGDLVEGQQCMSVASEKDDQFAAEIPGIENLRAAAADFERLEDHEIEEPPPSEWLEDTLIDLFLAGYPSRANSIASDAVLPLQSHAADASNVPIEGDGENYELEEGEWIPEDNNDLIDSNENDADPGTSWEEENWKAQYGQVSQPNKVSDSGFHFLDLWDWEMVPGTTKDGKVHGARLIGRLVKRSSKLHPSLPSGGTRLKTAPICEVLADLVRVKSGQIYRLRRPSQRFLESLLVYDSSNPTSGWGYPELSVGKVDGDSAHKEVVMSSKAMDAAEKGKSTAYRDRAAERRALHGGFGVGPGQKKAYGADTSPSQITACPEEAAAESMNVSFGAGSYARRLLENMGWKEGEALGRSTKGLLEPLQATGNKGNAGLGWVDSKARSAGAVTPSNQSTIHYSTGR